MNYKKNWFRPLDSLSPKEIMDTEWMKLKELKKVVPMSEEWFMVNCRNGVFPRPYGRSSNRRHLVWKTEDVNKFISELSASGATKEPEEKKAVTWDMVKELFYNEDVLYWTNTDIAEWLNASMTDVSALTRMMANAGEINKLDSPNNKSIMYTRANYIHVEYKAEHLLD